MTDRKPDFYRVRFAGSDPTKRQYLIREPSAGVTHSAAHAAGYLYLADAERALSKITAPGFRIVHVYVKVTRRPKRRDFAWALRRLACAKHDAALNDPRLSENDRARIQKHLADAIKERTEAKLEEFSEARHLIYLEKELTALRAKVAAGDELRKFVDAVANGSVWNAKDSAQFALANFDRAVKP